MNKHVCLSVGAGAAPWPRPPHAAVVPMGPLA